jgi:hypothetical protein
MKQSDPRGLDAVRVLFNAKRILFSNRGRKVTVSLRSYNQHTFGLYPQTSLK